MENKKSEKNNDKQFNKEFESYIESSKRKTSETAQEKLDILSKSEKKVHELSFGDILIGLKNTWFGIFDDITNKNISFDLITQQNRMFYIGITIILTLLLVFVYNEITNE